MEKITPFMTEVEANGQIHPVRYYDFDDGRRVMRADVMKAAGYKSHIGSYIDTAEDSLSKFRYIGTVPIAAAFWTAEQVKQFALCKSRRFKRINRFLAGKAILEQIFRVKLEAPHGNLFTGTARQATEPARLGKREIKFRAETFEGRIAYGWYNREEDGSVGIILPNQLEVRVKPESVAQLIGVDAGGVEVYEGDTVTDGRKTFAATFSHYDGITDGGYLHV